MELSKNFLFVGLGGAVGTWCRYLVVLASARLFGTAYPYGTLLVNVVGCFLIAVFVQVALSTEAISPLLKTVVVTGFLGGLTTYSSFNAETLRLAQERGWVAGLGSFALMTVSCLVAGVLGLALGRQLWVGR